MAVAVSLHNAGRHDDHSYLRIVQLSLLGSVLGNLLLVMGTAFLVGGIAHPRQIFNQEGMGVNSGMLIMAVASILLPSTLSETGTAETKGTSELNLSRFESVALLILYALYLIFQLVTHRHLYEEQNESGPSNIEAPRRLTQDVGHLSIIAISLADLVLLCRRVFGHRLAVPQKIQTVTLVSLPPHSIACVRQS